jgi:hypothetical protein
MPRALPEAPSCHAQAGNEPVQAAPCCCLKPRSSSGPELTAAARPQAPVLGLVGPAESDGRPGLEPEILPGASHDPPGGPPLYRLKSSLLI